MRSLTWAQVWGRRLARHALLTPQPRAHLVEVVRTVGGIHAQMMSAAELSIGARCSWRDPRGRARRTLAASQTGEDLRPARDGPSLSRRRGSVVGGCAPHASCTWRGAPARAARSGPNTARGHRRGDWRGAGWLPFDARRAGRRGDAPDWSMGDGPSQPVLRRAGAALAERSRRSGQCRAALLWPGIWAIK